MRGRLQLSQLLFLGVSIEVGEGGVENNEGWW